VAAEVPEGSKFVDFGGKYSPFLQCDYTVFKKDSKAVACVGFHNNNTKRAGKTTNVYGICINILRFYIVTH
jgi:hypothetical protein